MSGAPVLDPDLLRETRLQALKLAIEVNVGGLAEPPAEKAATIVAAAELFTNFVLGGSDGKRPA